MAARFKSELLVRARVDLGLTQEEAAQSVGVDVRTYRRYESGEVNDAGDFEVRRASRRKILERIERELGIVASDLVEDAPLLEHAPAPSPAPDVALPRARHFVGRAALLAHLQAWLDEEEGHEHARARVVAIVAMGGAGKTSLVERLLALRPASTSSTSPFFVHSFYEEPSVDRFFARAAERFEGGDKTGAPRIRGDKTGAPRIRGDKTGAPRIRGDKTGDPVDRLLAALSRARGALFVLDGLEIVQAPGREASRARGEIEDRRLVRFLRALVPSSSQGARAIVTSRSPLVDLAAFDGDGLLAITLPPLDLAETSELVRRWGVEGTSAAIGDLHAQTGGHALAIAVTGSYAAEMLDADLDAALRVDLEDAARDEPLARRLHRLLESYADELAPLDRDVLAHVCVFPRGIDEGGLLRIPKLAGERSVDVRASVARLVRRGLAVQGGEGRVTAHPFIREHFRAHVVDAAAIHGHERERLRAHVRAGLEGVPLHRPEERALLDACEALFEHTLLAGDAMEAFGLLAQLLGGFEHLGLRLGEFERGLRMTRAFDDVLDRDPERLPSDARWRLRYDRGLYSAALGDLVAAERAYRAHLAGAGDNVTAHRTLAYTLRLMGRFDEAHAHVTRSVDQSRREASTGAEARGLALRGAIFTAQERWPEAKQAFAEARALGDVPTARRGIWEAECWLAAREPGDLERAVASTRENLDRCERRGWAGHVAHCHVLLGRAALAASDREGAQQAVLAASAWCERSRETELYLWTRLLALDVAGAASDDEAAQVARAQIHQPATAGGYGLILRELLRRGGGVAQDSGPGQMSK